uniref:Putative basic tail-containing salivary secreted peptide n=1 Tax=Psorophora albipes TaxID=869069 RepID=T1E387_9DIPT
MGPTSAVVLVALFLLATLIAGPIERSQAAPAVTIIDGPLTKGSDPKKTDTTVVHLIYYLSYLIDHLIRHYVPNWAMTSPQEASDYFDKALVQGTLDEPKEDGKRGVFKPKPEKAEKSVQVVHTISRSKE